MPHLIYVVGPSGAGKDSVLAWLRQRIPASQGVHFAQRCIDRPVQAGSQPPHESVTAPGFHGSHEAHEAHEAVDTAGFLALLQIGRAHV